jgi:TetR/AcrR family transcriptional regulator
MPGMEHTAMNPVFDAPPGNPFARDFEHGAALFDAAVAEFVARGYEQASINSILAAAGMSKGQFYYHFGSKEALYFALIDILIAQKQAFLRAVMRPEDLAGDIFDIFQAQIGYSMAFAREHPVINRFSESFLRERGNAIYKAAMARYNFEENAGINDLIDAAHRRGEFRDDLPLPFIKKTIGYLFTHVAELAGLDRVDDAEADLRHLIEFMRSGLAGD